MPAPFRSLRAASSLALLAALPLLSAAPREVRVAAASDLRFALEELVAEGAAAGLRPSVVYGSSGSFFAQIANGGPFDLFLSADADYPRQLAARGLADGDVFVYGYGKLALWVPRGSQLDLAAPRLGALLDPSVRKVAIANPRHAPYGRAAEAALRSFGAWEAVQGKLVLGENVAQAAQFVESGGADAGLVALSLALAPRMREAGRFVVVPPESYPRLEQGGVVLKGATDPAAARALRDLLLGPRGREVLSRNGFTLPPP